ncbi:ActS/PrrB/RegB family redox-sensitive histidine kinase [Aliishimia ponticola]|uniref:histidine kinase n=1 Tax=Aliishimia ponticola TaxID=2499833 RepID=A0A4S4NA50_9RHOB|nr:ActS/PrrB/RegB family redox-sensitive histidine kinase [Aliishimia ponticola]THH34871.1 ActS/PrrB/RegB family redox-sensitive histidine kinase [Aliishimia ponticola]
MDFLAGQNRSSWVRLRTLILLRWVAILGQIIALTVAERYYGLILQMGLCYLMVGISVMGNLIAIFVFPENARLSERQNFFMVLFDVLQLGCLLFLTGGLHNPFAVMLMGPVMISASILTVRYYLIIGATAVLIVSVLSTAYLPLRTSSGAEMSMPDIFLFGTWIALVIAVIFFGAYSRRVTTEMHSMSDALSATQMALAREQKLTDLGGVVAAAAHELGTPLATIKLTSSELIEELEDQPELREDVELIRDQADRCRDIMRNMGRAGKDDVHLRRAPISALVEEAAEPHEGRGIELSYHFAPIGDVEDIQPSVLRKPEVIHGLRNLIQNAVDFASRRVWIDVEWSEDVIAIRVSDDGPGYPPAIIGRIGDPFVRRGRRSNEPAGQQRDDYEGMGLGLFIAKTLLERSGATIVFANGRENFDPSPNAGGQGAVVKVSWPRDVIDARTPYSGPEYEQNKRIAV